MSKLDNIVGKVTFDNMDDLYWQLDKLLETNPKYDGKNLTLKHIQILDEHNAFVYLEEDANTIMVQLIDSDGNSLLHDDGDYPFDYIVMSFEELRYILDGEEITYEGETYQVRDDVYCMTSNGGRYVRLYLA